MPCDTCSPLEFTAGDTLPDLKVVYRDEDNAPIDITGYTLQLKLRRTDNTLLVKTANLTDPTQGVALFSWDPDDLIAGTQPADVEVTNLQGKTLTLTGLTFVVRPKFS